MIILSELLVSRTLSTISYSRKLRMSTGRKTMGARFLLLSPDFKFISNFKNNGKASTLNVTSHAFKTHAAISLRILEPNLKQI